MRLKPLLLALLLALLSAPLPSSDPDNVIEIGTFEDLAAFARRAAREDFMGVRVRLTADIRACGRLRAIGSASHMFRGEFDGQGHVLSGLVVWGPRGSQGLFACVGPEGVIRGVALEGARVSGAGYAGGIAGYCAGRIEDCRVIRSRVVNLSRAPYGTAAGGLAGVASGYIGGCTVSESAVRGPANVGGLCGAFHAGLLERSAFSGAVVCTGAGQAPCGGLAGSLHGGARMRFCAGCGAVASFLNEYAAPVAGGVFSGSGATGCLFAGPGAPPALRRLLEGVCGQRGIAAEPGTKLSTLLSLK